jgi:hypothetical protein
MRKRKYPRPPHEHTYVVRALGKTTTPPRAAGLTGDPFVCQAKFHLSKIPAKTMDCRVEPGNDEKEICARPEPFPFR